MRKKVHSHIQRKSHKNDFTNHICAGDGYKSVLFYMPDIGVSYVAWYQDRKRSCICIFFFRKFYTIGPGGTKVYMNLNDALIGLSGLVINHPSFTFEDRDRWCREAHTYYERLGFVPLIADKHLELERRYAQRLYITRKIGVYMIEDGVIPFLFFSLIGTISVSVVKQCFRNARATIRAILPKCIDPL